MDGSWITLQRTVAVGMIVVLVTPMVVVLQQFVPPLAIASVLFDVILALTWLRPRSGAIGVGVLAGFWFLWQLANLSMVIPDLTRPSATLFFLITLGILVVPAAGIVGLVGVLRDAPSRSAVRTLQVARVAMVGGLVVSLLAGLELAFHLSHSEITVPAERENRLDYGRRRHGGGELNARLFMKSRNR